MIIINHADNRIYINRIISLSVLPSWQTNTAEIIFGIISGSFWDYVWDDVGMMSGLFDLLKNEND